MAQADLDVRTPGDPPQSPFLRWLLEGQVREVAGPFEREKQTEHHQHPWWQVMCLTGVDYFSTLGYQPGIAAMAAGSLAPLATIILVLVTLFAALPIYSHVSAESPHGEGSIAMLENLLSRWAGKLFVLALLGFVATDFVITITLSAADATAHVVENPFFPSVLHHHTIGVTLVLVTLLAAVFLKGFREAIGLAVFLVGTYLVLNVVVVAVSVMHVAQHPELIGQWRQSLYTAPHVGGNPMMMLALALFLFPRLALGLSGFETGVAVMPLVKGDPGDTPERPTGRIRNTRKLLATAALIMSAFLITSSFATTMLIPHQEFEEGGKAAGRALAYLAHMYLGSAFGTVYDLSTIFILWFAGASAMAGLLNIVPRYLPRYGMAPDWTRATRPLVLVFTTVAFLVTIIFRANVEAQGGAYATGVLVLISSAAIAVLLSVKRRGRAGRTVAFSIIALVFIYTTVVNVYERPEGIKIASLFIAAIVVLSLISRIYRTTELRARRIDLDEAARRFVEGASRNGEIHVIANKRQAGDALEYRLKEAHVREENNIPSEDPVIFLEVNICDASQFSNELDVRGVEIAEPNQPSRVYHVLRADASAAPNAIAALLLYLRDATGRMPHAYFEWSEGNPLRFVIRYLLFGEGDTAPVTHEVLRRAEPNPALRPVIHLGG